MTPNSMRNRIALAVMAGFAAAAAVAAPGASGHAATPSVESAVTITTETETGNQTLARKAGKPQQQYLVITSS